MLEQNRRKVIEIKDDEEMEECMHRIKEFYRCKTCENLAQICAKECPGVTHEEKEYKHQRVNYEDFRHNFRKFDEEFALQVRHYARQIEEIQYEAIEGIKKKKADTLKHLDDFKAELVKMTYPDLRTLHTTLYEKLKNERYDRLKCNEVDWMISTARRRIPFKHSEINKKMETIVKSFQNFKDVSKNLTSKGFSMVNKSKAKSAKQDLKNAEFQVAPAGPKITLPPIDYTQQKNAKISDQCDQLNENINRKKTQIERLTKMITDLKRDANGLIDRIRRQNRLTICSNVIVFGNSSSIQQKFMNKKESSRIEPFWSSYVQQSPQAAPVAMQNSIKLSNSAQKAESKTQNNNFILPFLAERAKQIVSKLRKQAEESMPPKQRDYNRSESEEERRFPISSSRSKDENSGALPNPQGRINEENEPPRIQPQQAQNEQMQEESQEEDQEDEQSAPPAPPKEPVVKHEQADQRPKSTWGPDLLDQMRQYGQTQDKALKTENIDRIHQFPTYSFNSSIRNVNSLFKNNTFEQKKRKINPFAAMAMELFEKSDKKKESKLVEEEKK